MASTGYRSDSHRPERATVARGRDGLQTMTMKERHDDDEDDLAVDNAPVRDAANSKVEFMALHGQGTRH